LRKNDRTLRFLCQNFNLKIFYLVPVISNESTNMLSLEYTLEFTLNSFNYIASRISMKRK